MSPATDSQTTHRILPCNIRAAIFFNGDCDLPNDFFRYNPAYNDFDFFCADGGANTALKFGIIPDAVIGDMDSITPANRRKLEKLSKFIVHPVDKEKSDGELALNLLLEQGYSEIHIFAATGGRIDQTLFNLQLLQGKPQCRMITREEEIFFLPSGSIIENRAGCRASLIPTTSFVSGLTISGFKFNLHLADLNYGNTLTLSNVIMSDSARVTYQQGGLLLVVTRGSGEGAGTTAGGLQLIKGKKGR